MKEHTSLRRYVDLTISNVVIKYFLIRELKPVAHIERTNHHIISGRDSLSSLELSFSHSPKN